MPLHYAISELAIVAAAAWAAGRLSNGRKNWAAAGVALFGLAALIGTVRILSGATDALEGVHAVASQSGGVAGAILIACQMARARGAPIAAGIAVSAATAGTLAGLTSKPLSAAAMIAALLIAVVAQIRPSLLRGVADAKADYLHGAGVAIMLVNIVAIRRSPLIDPAIAWHAFHALTAIWIVVVASALGPRNGARAV